VRESCREGGSQGGKERRKKGSKVKEVRKEVGSVRKNGGWKVGNEV